MPLPIVLHGCVVEIHTSKFESIPCSIYVKALLPIGHYTKYSNHMHVNPNESDRILKK